MELLQITQMTPYELENIIEKILVKVLNRYVDKQENVDNPKSEREVDKNYRSKNLGKVLSIDEACAFTGYAKSYLYKLTSAGILPFSKPNGKTIFFDKAKLEEWMLSHGSPGRAERETVASNYITSK